MDCGGLERGRGERRIMMVGRRAILEVEMVEDEYRSIGLSG